MTKYSIVGLTLISSFGLAACGGDDSDFAGASATLGGTTTGEGLDGSTDDGDDRGSSTSDTGADESESGGAETGEICTQEDFNIGLEPMTSNVVLVLDKSNSMNALWDHDANPDTATVPRWNSLHRVVETLLGSFEAEINFGAQLFPAADAWLDEPINDMSCLVTDAPEVSVASMNAQAILDAIPPAEGFTISGGTPAVAGFENAVEHLQSLPANEPKAIVLVTDGAANCDPDELPGDTLFVYDDRLPQTVGDAFTLDQIPTYVVGINILDEMGTKPSVNTYDSLIDVALAGGAPKMAGDPFYNVFSEMELQAALDEVASKIECTVTLPEEPEFPEELAIDVAGQPVFRVDSCDQGDGWAWTSPNGPYNTLELCGSACTALQDAAAVDVHYGCPE